jgi:hypothetical protein
LTGINVGVAIAFAFFGLSILVVLGGEILGSVVTAVKRMVG